MRTILTIAVLPPLLALAACGYRNFEKPDGTFDREGYRALMGNACGAGLLAGDVSIPSETRSRICTCVIDRMLDRTDDELRATVHDRALGDRAQQAATQQCLVSLGFAAPPEPVFDPRTRQWVDPVTGAPAGPGGGVDDEEPPPPEEPSPGAMTAPPSPVVRPPHEAENRRAMRDAARQMDEATRAAEDAMRQVEGR